MDTITREIQVERSNPSDDELIKLFVEDCRLQRLSPETIRSHKSNLRTISRFLKSQGLSFTDVDKHVLKMMLDYLPQRAKGFNEDSEKLLLCPLQLLPVPQLRRTPQWKPRPTLQKAISKKVQKLY